MSVRECRSCGYQPRVGVSVCPLCDLRIGEAPTEMHRLTAIRLQQVRDMAVQKRQAQLQEKL